MSKVFHGKRSGRIFSAISVLAVACGPAVPYGKLSFGEFSAEGVVDQDYLEAQMAPLEPMFQACYAQSLRRNHQSEGVIRLALEGGSGKLQGKVVENATGDEGLGRCVTDAISTIPLVERGGKGPWAFTADWSVNFEIARPRKRTE
jgi:hypothetical protein